VLDLDDGQVAGWTSFLDAETIFHRFGLPLVLARENAGA
jgi:hypothetical protein